MITKSMLDNSLAVLQMPADGSQANAQARQTASAILVNYIASLNRFIELNPCSNVAKTLRGRVEQYNSILEVSNVH